MNSENPMNETTADTVADDAQAEAEAPKSLNRRRFLTRAGITGAAAAGLGLLGTAETAQAAPALPVSFDGTRVLDRNILNFALNLEYLEAEYYLRATTGEGLSEDLITGVGDVGEVSGGRQVNFETPAVRQYAAEIADDERNHVRILREFLGGVRVARPALNLGTAFTAAAQAAGIIGPNDTFDPYANENNFLLGAFVFEDVGVTAYNGAVPFLDNVTSLSVATSIGLVEGYHAGEVRTILYGRGQQTPFLIDAANAISALREAADSAAFKDQGLTDRNGNANIVPADRFALAFARTFQEVLNIVYLGGESANFGFFPNRLNGLIR